MINRHRRAYIHTQTDILMQRSTDTKTDKVAVVTCSSSGEGEVKRTCSCPFKELRSSAFFSRDWTHTFLFCLQREAAALLRSRNLRRFSSGSSLVVLRRRPPVLGGFCAGGTGEAWTIMIILIIRWMQNNNWQSKTTSNALLCCAALLNGYGYLHKLLKI